MKNKATVTGANIVFFVFVILFIVFQIVLLILSGIIDDNLIEENTYSILLVNEYIIVLIPALLYIVFKKLSFREVLRLNKLEFSSALFITVISVPAYFTALMLNNIVIYFLDAIGNVPDQTIPVPGDITELVIGILVVGISPAICEEILNRGVLLKAYENRGSMKAVVITSILFGIFHFDISNFLGPVFLGLMIGYYVIRTNSIFAGMLAHFLNNTIAELLQFFVRGSGNESQAAELTHSDLIYLIAMSAVGILVVGLLLKLFRYVVPQKGSFKPSISSIKDDVTSVISHWPIIVVLAMYAMFAALYILIVTSSTIGVTQ